MSPLTHRTDFSPHAPASAPAAEQTAPETCPACGAVGMQDGQYAVEFSCGTLLIYEEGIWRQSFVSECSNAYASAAASRAALAGAVAEAERLRDSNDRLQGMCDRLAENCANATLAKYEYRRRAVALMLQARRARFAARLGDTVAEMLRNKEIT